ncbi:MAG: inositol monophosphatase [Myxococcales bacterium]|nr:inositol monophosphatase [Myxococcales bacterium]
MEVAIEAARRGGEVLMARRGAARTVELKGGIDLVTDADRASEAAVLELLRSRFPGHAVLAEESGLTEAGRTHRWIVDPLDGTTNYSHRVPHFCVSVAVEGPEGLLAGAILDPVRGELFAAGKGLGATLNGSPMRASQVGSLEGALLSTGFPYDIHERPEAPLGLFNRFIRRAQGVRRMGSAALDLAYVACGRFDGFFEFGLRPWDIAAGALLVSEAGGRVTRIDGRPLELSNGDVLAANGPLAEALLRECTEFLLEIGWKGAKPASPKGEGAKLR